MRPASLVLTCVISLTLAFPAHAQQQAKIFSRITQAIDESVRTALAGNTHPLARARFDHGAAPATLPLSRMLLVLKRSPEQEQALRQMLDQQQDRSSSNYHRWLTPQQFGEQYGPSDQDIQTVAAWLQSQGLRVDRIAKGRGTIEFSGSASQLTAAFHTQIHQYVIDGKSHWANAADPQIPSALTPVVAGVATLHNFLKQPQLRVSPTRIFAKVSPGATPQVTIQGLHALGPADFATIYHINPLYQAGINGTNTIIAVVARSNINVQDVWDFNHVFGVNANGSNPSVVIDGADPGDLGGGEEVEAVLDATWAGAIAPSALVDLVVSASTDTTDGVDLSEQYIVDNDLANVMTESFGTCEALDTNSDATFHLQLAEQAAAEGITYLVASGDSGSAGCDSPNETRATGGLSVNVLASTPFDVAVGGTQFNEGANSGNYWNSSNTSGTQASAKSYIPEYVWNESCPVASCGQNANLAAGGGGASTFFSKPSWQSGVSGIPNDGKRDLPDVAFTAAAGHDPYLLCVQGSCSTYSQGTVQLYAVGGTSASTPSFAGIMALLNQKMNARQGMVGYTLYKLAANETLSRCNASNTSSLPAGNCVFNDVTVGNNAVPGEAGYGTGSATYTSTLGYDRAS
ncbi:MAG TPA: S53 family peptidase, partial [Terriglobales bacterium]|nr:S53 family peptidase [Terriglobales bacterium]